MLYSFYIFMSIYLTCHKEMKELLLLQVENDYENRVRMQLEKISGEGWMHWIRRNEIRLAFRTVIIKFRLK